MRAGRIQSKRSYGRKGRIRRLCGGVVGLLYGGEHDYGCFDVERRHLSPRRIYEFDALWQ